MSRNGNFSSSGIYQLMSNGKAKGSVGKAFTTYARQKRWERKLGRSLSQGFGNKATKWGTLVERQAYEKLLARLCSYKYELVSDVRYKHKDYPDYWTGMPDLINHDEVGDIKCPFSLNQFIGLLESFVDLQTFKKAHPDYYWQLVSNAILCDVDKAVLVVYVPYKKDLAQIRDMASLISVETGSSDYNFLQYDDEESLPYLPDNCGTPDVNCFHFDVSEEDKQALTERVKLAIKEL